MNSLRWLHKATLLPDGRVLIAGGTSAPNDGLTHDASILSSAEIYNPSTGTFSLAGTMNYPRQELTSTLLLNGKVLIAGGYGGSSIDTSASELYDPSTGQFTIASKMIVSRTGHFATLLSSGKVLVSGGGQRSAELFTPP